MTTGNSAPATRRAQGRRLWNVIPAGVPPGTSLEVYDVLLYGTAAALVVGDLLARGTVGRDLEAVAEGEGVAWEDDGPPLEREAAAEQRVRTS